MKTYVIVGHRPGLQNSVALALGTVIGGPNKRSKDRDFICCVDYAAFTGQMWKQRGREIDAVLIDATNVEAAQAALQRAKELEGSPRTICFAGPDESSDVRRYARNSGADACFVVRQDATDMLRAFVAACRTALNPANTTPKTPTKERKPVPA